MHDERVPPHHRPVRLDRHDAATRRDHRLRFPAGIGEHGGFERAEGGLAIFREDARDRLPGPPLQLRVRVHRAPAEPLRQPPRDRALPAPTQPNEDNPLIPHLNS